MLAVLRALLSLRMLLMLFMGFSSGLPLLVTGSTLQAWMKDANVDLSVIGVFSLVGLPYTFKFVWAPVLDRFVPPFWGRRRGWMLVAQLGLAISILSLSVLDPSGRPWLIGVIALFVTFFSATQDIVLDAYRREYLPTAELGLGTGVFVNGYRLGMLVSGALALFLADRLPWSTVYQILAGCMLVGLLTSLLAPEPSLEAAPPRSLREAVVEPFVEYFGRPGAFEILAFFLLYKLGDLMASAMTTPLILDLGYTKTQLAAVAKTFGMAATMAGGLAGGIAMLKLGMKRSLWAFGLLQAGSTLGFAVLAARPTTPSALALVVGFENLTGGMGTSAFTAFMATLTNKRFTATQYALLTSLMGVPRVILAAPSGIMAKAMGWEAFFVFCTLMAVPGLLLLLRYDAWLKDDVPSTLDRTPTT